MPRAQNPNPTGTGAKPGHKLQATPNKVDPRTVAAVAYQAGFRGRQLVTAVAVSFAENGSHDCTAQNLNTDGSVDTGLWQINSVHGIPIRTLFDAQANANAAWRISSHGRDWTPWSTYPIRSGAQMVQAQATVAAMNRAGGAVQWLKDNPINSSAKGGVLSPGIGTQIERSGPWSAVSGFLGEITSSSLWLRVGEVVGGAILLIVGILLLVKNQIPKGAVGAVAAVA